MAGARIMHILSGPDPLHVSFILILTALFLWYEWVSFQECLPHGSDLIELSQHEEREECRD